MADEQVCMFFCEDVREEVGNKMSVMGLLGPQILLDHNEARSGRMKSLVVGALCRFSDSNERQGELETRFLAGNEEVAVPPAPKPMPISLVPDEDGGEWISQIIAVFNNLPVHVGMRVECTLRLNEQEYGATLTVIDAETNEPEAET